MNFQAEMALAHGLKSRKFHGPAGKVAATGFVPHPANAKPCMAAGVNTTLIY
jgi:hypothetical protein